jgi:hypothetical protein
MITSIRFKRTISMRKAKNAHTIAEIILSRWTETAHKCFLFFSFLTNLLVSSVNFYKHDVGTMFENDGIINETKKEILTIPPSIPLYRRCPCLSSWVVWPSQTPLLECLLMVRESHQPIDLPTNSLTNPSTHQSTNPPTYRPTPKQFTNPPTNPPIYLSTNHKPQTTNQSMLHTNTKEISSSAYYLFNLLYLSPCHLI